MFAVVESRVSGAKGSGTPETWSGAHKSRLVLGQPAATPPHLTIHTNNSLERFTSLQQTFSWL